MQNYQIQAKQHRANARAALGGNIFSNCWMMSLVVTLIASFISGVTGAVSAGIISIFVYGPLSTGLSKCFLDVSRKHQVDIKTLFYGFENDFVQSFLIGLMTALFTFLWSLLFIIPGIVKYYAYSMAYYVKCDNPTYDWKQCLDESQRITKGKKWKLFCLDLSFIGWIFVCTFTCGIGTLWVNPYMYASKTSFYESIKENVQYQQPEFADFN